MNGLFNIDSPIMRFLSRLFDLIILNLLFVLSCIPIITIGTAITSMTYVNLKTVRKEDPYIWQNYWKAFRQNFVQSTIIWVFCLLFFGLLYADYYIVNASSGSFLSVLQIGLWIVSLFFLCIVIYVFPVIAHFVCSTKQAIKNAALMSIAHLPYTIVFLLLFGLVAFLCLDSNQSFAFVVVASGICGCSVFSLICCFLFNRIFEKYTSA